MPSFTSHDGLNIKYRVLGEGEPVVLVHGWMVCGNIWELIIGSLLEAGKQLIIPNQRGTGSSDKPEQGYTLANYAADLLTLVDAAGLDRFKLVGHSMGGQISQLVATQLSDRIESMTLLCPVPASGLAVPSEIAELFRHSGGDRKAQMQIIDMSCRELDERGQALLLSTSGSVSKECVAQSFDAWTAGGFADRLPSITCKTYVVGTDDPFLPPDLLREAVVGQISNAEFVYIPGFGHYPQIESPTTTAAKLRDLLA